MASYEFKAGGKKGRNRFVGSWSETASKSVSRPFTVDALREVLGWGASPDSSTFTHQDIAHWCGRFHIESRYSALDEAMNGAIDVAADVDAQWELYLANTYSLEQLQALDFSKVRLPVEWFCEWLNRL